jgi:hypothetical protein
MSSHLSLAQDPDAVVAFSIPRVQNNGTRCLVPSIISITRRQGPASVLSGRWTRVCFRETSIPENYKALRIRLEAPHQGGSGGKDSQQVSSEANRKNRVAMTHASIVWIVSHNSHAPVLCACGK